LVKACHNLRGPRVKAIFFNKMQIKIKVYSQILNNNRIQHKYNLRQEVYFKTKGQLNKINKIKGHFLGEIIYK